MFLSHIPMSCVQISIQQTAILTGALLRFPLVICFQFDVATADISHMGHQRFLPDPLPVSYALKIQSPDLSGRAV